MLVSVVAVVGDEDGEQHRSAGLFQALNDVGNTMPAQAVTYWVGDAMQGNDYNDFDEAPQTTASTTLTLARDPHHLA